MRRGAAESSLIGVVVIVAIGVFKRTKLVDVETCVTGVGATAPYHRPLEPRDRVIWPQRITIFLQGFGRPFLTGLGSSETNLVRRTDLI